MRLSYRGDTHGGTIERVAAVKSRYDDTSCPYRMIRERRGDDSHETRFNGLFLPAFFHRSHLEVIDIPAQFNFHFIIINFDNSIWYIIDEFSCQKFNFILKTETIWRRMSTLFNKLTIGTIKVCLETNLRVRLLSERLLRKYYSHSLH